MSTATATAPRLAASAPVLFFLSTFIWGTTWLVIKFQLGRVAPEVSVGWRFGVAALLLLGWAAARRLPLRFALRDHLAFALLGLLLFGLNYVLVYRAELHLTSGLVAVLFAFLVFWNMAGARLFFGAPSPPAVLAGALLGVLGVALLFWPELQAVKGDAGLGPGVGYAVGGTVVASAGNLWSQRLFGRGLPVIQGTGWAMLYASLAVLAFCAVRGLPLDFDARAPYVLSLLYLALFGSVVAFVAYLTLLKQVGAGKAGYTAAVIPAVAMLASTLFEDYQWTLAAAAGLALVLAGTVLVLRAKERAAGR
ncbi:MAG TPA: EamA family transporter [Anaeromyxobacteraceae bacterium]|nr:EamA family transporter [Anaeromyxobacteraceae bacterium]